VSKRFLINLKGFTGTKSFKTKMKQLTLPTRRKPPDKPSKTKPKTKSSKSAKRKRDISSQNQVQPQRIPFWNNNCTAFSSSLHFGVQNEPERTMEKEWGRREKKLARRSWFDCKFYRHSVSKDTWKKWSCPSWGSVMSAIEEEEKRKEEKKQQKEPAKKKRDKREERHWRL